jgi:hypothetical protein
MNRRSFITKALVGIAAVPLIGKLVKAEPQAASYEQRVLADAPVLYWRLDCPIDFAAAMRERILREVKEHGKSTLCSHEVSTAFDKWDHEQVEEWANHHNLYMYVTPDGRIIVRCAYLSQQRMVIVRGPTSESESGYFSSRSS